MHQRRSFGIARRLQPALAKLTKESIDIRRRHDDDRAKYSIVPRKGELIAAAAERDEIVLTRIVVGAGPLEVEHPSVERDRFSQVVTAQHRDQRHAASTPGIQRIVNSLNMPCV